MAHEMLESDLGKKCYISYEVMRSKYSADLIKDLNDLENRHVVAVLLDDVHHYV